MLRAARIKGEWRVLIGLAAALVGASPLLSAGHGAPDAYAIRVAGGPSRLVLRSLNFIEGGTIGAGQVYDRSGCRGGNISPGLSWTGAPLGTHSFAVLMLDPDAPGGSWWHWAAFDIPAAVTALRAGAGDPGRRLMPAGAVQVRNDWGSVGYGGPCPPPGPPHHYRLMLYALGTPKLGLGADATAAQVANKARATALAEAQIVAIYGR